MGGGVEPDLCMNRVSLLSFLRSVVLVFTRVWSVSLSFISVY